MGMEVSPLPSTRHMQKTAISAAAALLVALNPLHALAAETVMVPDQPAVELSPAQMLVKKTTDAQVTSTPLSCLCHPLVPTRAPYRRVGDAE